MASKSTIRRYDYRKFCLTTLATAGSVPSMTNTARQALVIAANRAGWSLLPDNDQWQNRIEIKSETSTRVYTVAQNKANLTWGCSCFGWKRYRHCKHLDNMMPTLRQLTDQRGR